MDEQLLRAPCGYIAFNKDFEIIELNHTLSEMLQLTTIPKHFSDLLTIPSKVYFQTYFIPAISVHGKVTEMYLHMKSNENKIPILMNVNQEKELYECVLMKIYTRDEYEKELLQAKKEALRIQSETDEANKKLTELLKEVEEKQQLLIELNKELHEQATSDPLTGLANRRVFDQQLSDALSGDEPFSLAIIDIDYFKKVNDTYGHHIGDKVLQELADKLQSKILSPHLLARVGGEEFGVIFYCGDEEAKIALKQLHAYLTTEQWAIIPITVSGGLAAQRMNDTYIELYERADQALYQAKEAGRNQVIIAS